MKKYLIILALFAGLAACENFENDFPDYDYTTGYFPYQYPVRTLVLGDDIYDNTNDNNHKFLISAAMGGVYANDKDRVFDIELAPELCSNVQFGSAGEAIQLMPQNYYTLSSNQITIPAGKVNGGVEVQLTDAFFNDPLAIKLAYVIPVRLVSSADVDTILQGKAVVSNPDPRVAGDWETVPKNFTMFAVKYINPYHGTYFRRGSNVVKNPTGNILENNSYHAQYIVQDGTWDLVTAGMDEISVTSKFNSIKLSGDLAMDLSFGSDGNCTVIQQSSGATIGTGKFVENGDEWGGKKRNAIILSYDYPIEYIAPPPPEPRVIVNDNNSAITYTGSWTLNNAEAACYGGNRSYSSTAGNYLTFSFTGDGIEFYFKTGSSYGSFDVYLDNVQIADDVSLVTSTTMYQQKMFETTFPYGDHTIRIEVGTAGKYTIFDYLVYTALNPPVGLPSGTYTLEAKDTLVVRDRGVSLELYAPVISE